MRLVSTLIVMAALTSLSSVTKADTVGFDRDSSFWFNQLPHPVLINFRAQGANCSYSNGGSSTGTAGPIPAGGRGDYNPTLNRCSLTWNYCDYNAWNRGTCRLRTP